MKETLFKVLYVAAGLFCLVLLVYTKYPKFFGSETARKTNRRYYLDTRKRDAGLYNLAFVRDLKPADLNGYKKTEALPVLLDKPPEHDINDAEVIFMGDSFFMHYFGTDFERYTGRPAYSYRYTGRLQPMEYLKKEGLRTTGSGPKTLVLGMVERNIILQLSRNVLIPLKRPKSSAFDDAVRKYLLIDDNSLELHIKSNSMIKEALFARNTFRFRAFGLIWSRTPVYSLNPPMLFFKDEVDFNSDRHAADKAAVVADNLQKLARELKARYGIRLIFMPIPNKISIYGRYAGVKYNGFLPALYRRLDKLGVEHVELYQDDLASPEQLYHSAGTHWNYDGAAIAMRKLVRMLDGPRTGQHNPAHISRSPRPHIP